MISIADKILAHTKPPDLEVKSIDAVAEGLGLPVNAGPKLPTPSTGPEVWETLTFAASPGALEQGRRPIPLGRPVGTTGLGI